MYFRQKHTFCTYIIEYTKFPVLFANVQIEQNIQSEWNIAILLVDYCQITINLQKEYVQYKSQGNALKWNTINN